LRSFGFTILPSVAIREDQWSIPYVSRSAARILSFEMWKVTLISLGQTSTQLKMVWQRHRPC